jgi:mannose-6-phosphate isomerase-like protein (cupin superfamily)
MNNYIQNLEEATIANENFRTVLYTDDNLQLVLMAIQPGENIPKEVHSGIDQFIRVEAGEGEVIISDTTYPLTDGTAIIIPKGVAHEIVNTSPDMVLKLYTIYTPPEHAPGTVQVTRAEALAAEDDHQS